MWDKLQIPCGTLTKQPLIYVAFSRVNKNIKEKMSTVRTNWSLTRWCLSKRGEFLCAQGVFVRSSYTSTFGVIGDDILLVHHPRDDNRRFYKYGFEWIDISSIQRFVNMIMFARWANAIDEATISLSNVQTVINSHLYTQRKSSSKQSPRSPGWQMRHFKVNYDIQQCF